MAVPDLQLYGPYAEGIRYLLAQSSNTRDLVPEVEEGKWELIGKKKGVKASHLYQLELLILKGQPVLG